MREAVRRRKLRWAALITLCLLAAAFGSLGGLVLIDSADLPQVAELERYQPSTITELFDIHGERVGAFALQRRIAIPYEQFSPVLRDAVISIEDKGFEHHFGINPFRVIGAAWHDLRSRGRPQGASTLTMQLARNLFLSDERNAGRKLQETLLSIQIERSFTKPQIFTLYGNQIYLGRGAYGFEAGAQLYFSKHARDLVLPEAALLAGLPKGPEEFSPTTHPERALRRRNQVLAALLSDGKITRGEADSAIDMPLGLHLQPPPATDAPWFVEDVRRELEHDLGAETVHSAGLRVFTTLDLSLQRTANRAALDGLAAYERRQGWRGRLFNTRDAGFRHPDWSAPLGPGAYVHALVTTAASGRIEARVGAQAVLLTPTNWAWTGVAQPAHSGDLIYLHLTSQAPEGWRATLEQDSGAQASLLALDNASGGILAMVGGRDYAVSQYNRATEAQRQVGSSFKPYVYTAAVEAGATPEQTILDTPASFGTYTPRDYEGNTLGEITLEHAFADSRNIPAIRIAAALGMPRIAEAAHRFGITARIPPYLPVALGAVEISLAQQLSAYSVFPNDGLRVPPHLVRRVTDAEGTPVELPERFGATGGRPGATAVVSPQTARIMVRFLRSVTAPGGTGAAAAALDHPVAGKTGTTTGSTDAWFLGFSPSVTCGVWVGYDTRIPLGEGESGGKAALPIWMDWMRAADAAHPNERFRDVAKDLLAPRPRRR